ncbi:winged helix-turn-helix domain-containing protein [Dokdonella sp. MW10]|uniref:winged helix-turn-helix domain-containing protein n=1 Tax=Dokdonella sp. MW10 TaxID=2992926 RepID=UPI003F7CECE4
MKVAAYAFEGFRLVPATRELWRDGARVAVPRRSFECLEHLVAHRDRAVGRDELVAVVFGRADVSDAQLGQVVLRARRVLDDDGNAQRLIRTVPGFGYRWVGEVEVLAGDASGTARRERSERDAGVDPAVAPLDQDGGGEVDRLPGVADDMTSVAADAIPASAPASSTRRSSFDGAPDPAILVSGDARAKGSTAGQQRRGRARLAAWGALAVLVIVVAGVFAWRPGVPDGATDAAVGAVADTTATPSGLAVLPIRVEGLREDAWIRLGAMDLVADRLRQAGFAVPPSESVLAAIDAEAATEPAPRVRAATGAVRVVEGRARRDATGWHVELAAIGADGVRTPVQFADRDAMFAMRGATDLLLAALGRSAPVDGELDAPIESTLQRARAAMLANELDTARAILTASPQLADASALLRYQLAMVDLRGGQLDAAEASLTALLDDPATRADAAFHARVFSARGSTRMRRAAFAGGGADFDAALALLGTEGDALERGRARMGRANSRVPEHRYDEALADFGAARVDLETAGDALGVARVDANLGMLELYRGRPAAALDVLQPAAERFQSFGALHEFLVTLTAVIDAQLAMLQRADAAATVERAWALRERISDPDQQADVLLNRAQVSLGEGRYRDAAEALAHAQRTVTSGNRVLLARQRSLAADLAWRRGDARAAAGASAAALAGWPATGADVERNSVALLRQRSALANGEEAAVSGLFPRSEVPSPDAREGPGRVAEAIANAEWAARHGDAVVADTWFREAMARADRRGVPADLVAVALAWTPHLLARRDEAQAAVVVGRVAAWAARDYDCALLQVRLLHALGRREAWQAALAQARALAGEREIPAELVTLDAPPAPVRISQAAR